MAKLRVPRLKVTRRGFLRFAAGTGGLAAATGLYTWRIEPHWVQFFERPLPVANLPAALNGARLVQLSDLHIGPRVDDSYIVRVFNRVSALAPEIVVFTGDFTSYAPDVIDHTHRVFTALPRGTRGSFGVLGNHDYGPRWGRSEVADELAELARVAGTRILRNEVAEVDGLQIVGLDEYWAGRFDPVKAFAAWIIRGRRSRCRIIRIRRTNLAGVTIPDGFFAAIRTAANARLRSCRRRCCR